MLEQYVSTFLASYLGKYFRGISDKQLRVSLWSGELNLSNLELRPHALAPATLPVVIHRGYVGALKVTIPWTRLQSEPVVFTIEKLYILVRPKKGAAWDEEAEREADRERKERELQAYETQRAAQLAEGRQGGGAEQGKKKAQQTWVQKLQGGIANNVQVMVKSIHVRYEDPDIDPHHPVALGFLMTSGKCVSTNEDWLQEFVTDAAAVVHKMLSFEGWSAYLERCEPADMLIKRFPSSAQYEEEQAAAAAATAASGVSNSPSERGSAAPSPASTPSGTAAAAAAAAAADNNDVLWSEMDRLTDACLTGSRRNLVDPTTLSVRFRLQQTKALDMSSPKLTCDVNLKTLRFCTTHEQYQQVLRVCDYMTNFEGVDKFRCYLPRNGQDAVENPRQWWQFATSCVRHLVREKRSKLRIDWADVQTYLSSRKEYVALYKRTQDAPWLPPLDQAEKVSLTALHNLLKTHQLTFLREVAYVELAEERQLQANQKKLIEEKMPGRAAGAGEVSPPSGGWFGGWGRRWSAQPEEAAEEVGGQWTAEEKKQLALLGLADDSDRAGAALGRVESSASAASTSGPAGGGGGGVGGGMPPQYIESSILVSVQNAELALYASGGDAGSAQASPDCSPVGGASSGEADSDKPFSVFCINEAKCKVDTMAKQSCFKAVVSLGNLSVQEAGREVIRRCAAGGGEAREKLLLCVVERSPFDSRENGMSVDVVLSPVDIVLHPSYASSLSRFFRHPSEINLDISSSLTKNFQELAEAHYESLKAAGSVDVKLSMETGRLILPVEPPAQTVGVQIRSYEPSAQARSPFVHRCYKSFCDGAMVLNMGTFTLVTDAAHAAARAERVSRHLQLSGSDLYQRYNLRFEKMSAAFTRNLDAYLACTGWASAAAAPVPAAVAPLEEFVKEFDVHFVVEKLLAPAAMRPDSGAGDVDSEAEASPVSLQGCGSAAAESLPDTRVACEVSSAEIRLSREALLSALYTADTLTTFVNKLSMPNLPEQVVLNDARSTVKGLNNFLYEQVHVCRVYASVEEQVAAAAEPPLRTVVILRKGMLVVYGGGGGEGAAGSPASSFPRGSAASLDSSLLLSQGDVASSRVLPLTALYNLSQAPFRVAQKETSIVLTFPQTYSAAKVLVVEVADAAMFRSLFRAVETISSETLVQSSADLRKQTGVAASRDERVQMQLSFALKTLRVQLCNGPGVQPFSEVTFGGFLMDVAMRSFDQTVQLKLNSTVVETLEEGSGERSACVSSYDGAATSENLFEVTCTTCVDQSPLWSSAGPDCKISVSAASLYLSLTPGLCQTLTFFYDLIGVNKLSKAHVLREVYSAPLHYQNTAESETALSAANRVETHITAKMSEFSVTCLEEVAEGEFREFLEVSMQNSNIVVQTSGAGSQVKGVLGNVVATELPSKRQLLGMADVTQGSLIEVLYVATPDPNLKSQNARAKAIPYVNGRVTALMKQIKARLHFHTFGQVMHWSTQGSVICTLKEVANRTAFGVSLEECVDILGEGAAAASAAPSAPTPSVLMADLRIVNPLVMLPARVDDRPEDCLVTALGDVAVKTELVALTPSPDVTQVEYLSRVSINLRDVSVDVAPELKQPSAGKIGDGLNVSVVMLNYLTQPVLPDVSVLNSMSVAVGGVALAVDEGTWALLLQVAARNILSPYTPAYVSKATQPPPSQPFDAKYRGYLNVHADLFDITILPTHGVASAAASYRVTFNDVAMRQREVSPRGGGGTELDFSLEGFSITEEEFALDGEGAVGERRPLVECAPIDRREQTLDKVLKVVMVNAWDEENGVVDSGITVQFGEPTLYADPVSLFYVQDALVSQAAADAVALILSDKSAESACVQKSRLTTMQLSMSKATVIGLQSTDAARRRAREEFFRVTLLDAEARCVTGAGAAFEGEVAPGLALEPAFAIVKASVGGVDVHAVVPCAGAEQGRRLVKVMALPATPSAARQRCFIDVLQVRGVTCDAAAVAQATAPDGAVCHPKKGRVGRLVCQMLEQVPRCDLRSDTPPCAAPWPGAVDAGFRQKLSVKIDEVNVIALPGFWTWVIEWASTGAFSQLTMLGQLRADRLASRMKASANLTQINVHWSGPVVSFPTASQSGTADPDTDVTLVLGHLCVSNVLQARADGAGCDEVFTTSFTKLRLYHRGAAIGLSGPHGDVSYDLVRDFTLSAELRRKVDGGEAAGQVLSSEIGAIRFELSDAQVELLSAALAQQATKAPKDRAARAAARQHRSPTTPLLGSPTTAAAATATAAADEPATTASPLTCLVGFKGLMITLYSAPRAQVLSPVRTGGSFGVPFTTLSMRDVLVDYSGAGVTVTLQSVAVTELTAKAAHKRTIVTTLSCADAASAPLQDMTPTNPAEKPPPCFTVAFRSDADSAADRIDLRLRRLHVLFEPSYVDKVTAFIARVTPAAPSSPAALSPHDGESTSDDALPRCDDSTVSAVAERRVVSAVMNEFTFGILDTRASAQRGLVPLVDTGGADATLKGTPRNLVDESELLMLFELDDSTVSVDTCLATNDHTIDGSMGSFKLKDTYACAAALPSQAASEEFYLIQPSLWNFRGGNAQQHTRTPGQSIVDFKARSSNVKGVSGGPPVLVTHTSELSLTMRSLTFTHSAGFLLRAKEYQKEVLGAESKAKAASARSAEAKQVGQDVRPLVPLKYSILVLNPLVFLPDKTADGDGERRALVADLGQIVVKNEMSQPTGRTAGPPVYVEDVSVSLSNMGLSALHMGRDANVTVGIVEGAAVSVSLRTRLALPVAAHHGLPVPHAEAHAGARADASDLFALTSPRIVRADTSDAGDVVPDSSLTVTMTGAQAVLRQRTVALLLSVATSVSDSLGSGGAGGSSGGGAAGQDHAAAPPAAAASAGYTTLQVSVPVLSIVICSEATGEEVADLSLQGISYSHSGKQAEQWEEMCFVLRRIDLKEMWRQGSNRYCRGLCYSTEGGSAAATGGDDSVALRANVLKEVRSTNLEQNTVVVDMALPHFIFVTSLIVDCYNVAYKPYAAMLAGSDGTQADAASNDIAIEGSVTLDRDLHIGYVSNADFADTEGHAPAVGTCTYAATNRAMLHVSGGTDNVVEINGEKNRFCIYIHLQSFPCADMSVSPKNSNVLYFLDRSVPFVTVAAGVTLKFVDVNVVFYCENPFPLVPVPKVGDSSLTGYATNYSSSTLGSSLMQLMEELTSCGDGSYFVLAGNATLANSFYPAPSDTGAPPAEAAGRTLRRDVKMKFHVSFGVGIAGALPRHPGSATTAAGTAPNGRCVMLTGSVANGSFTSKSVVGDAPLLHCSFVLSDLSAVHLPVLPAMLQPGTNTRGGDIMMSPPLSPCPTPPRTGASKASAAEHSSYILEPTTLEVAWDCGDAGEKLQVIMDKVRCRLCLGDAECVSQFLASLPKAGAPASTPPAKASSSTTPKKWLNQATVNVNVMTFVLIDDTSGSTTPFFLASFKQNVAKSILVSPSETKYEAVTHAHCEYYNENACEWESLVEPFTAGVTMTAYSSGKTTVTSTPPAPQGVGQTVDAHLSASFVDVNVTPGFLAAYSAFASKSSGIASGTPLRIQPLFTLHNDTGRDVALAVDPPAASDIPATDTEAAVAAASAGGGVPPLALVKKTMAVHRVRHGARFSFDSSKPHAFVCPITNPEAEQQVFGATACLADDEDADGSDHCGSPRSDDGACELFRVPIGVVGTHRLDGMYVAEVFNRSGRKAVVLRTAVTVHNHLDVDVFVEGVGTVFSPHRPRRAEGEVQPAAVAGADTDAARYPSVRSVPHSSLRRKSVEVRPLGTPGGGAPAHGAASLGCLWSNLQLLDGHRRKYVATCPATSAADPAFSFFVHIDGGDGAEAAASSRGGGGGAAPRPSISTTAKTVAVHLYPLLRVTNQLPVPLNINVGTSVLEVPPFGGHVDVDVHASRVDGAEQWPHCKVGLGAGCFVGREVQTQRQVLVWNGPTKALLGTGASRVEELLKRAAVLDMRSDTGAFYCLAHLHYCERGHVTVYAPLWAVNRTQHRVDVAAPNASVPTALPPKGPTPLPITSLKPTNVQGGYPAINTVFVNATGGGNPSNERLVDVGDLASGGESALVFTNDSAEGSGLYTHLGASCEVLTYPDTEATTRVVTLVPRWVFHNTTQHELTVRLVLSGGTRPSMTVRPGESKACSSSGHQNDNLVELKYSSDALVNNRYSRAFSVGKEDTDLMLRLNYEPKKDGYQPGRGCFVGATAPNGGLEYFRVIHATASKQKGCINITFREAAKPPFVLENRTDYWVRFVQTGVQPPASRTLPPRTTVPYALDDPFAEAVVLFKFHTTQELGSYVGERALRLTKPAAQGEKVQFSSKQPPVYYKVSHGAAAGMTVTTLSDNHYVFRRCVASRAAAGGAGLQNGVWRVSLEGFGVGLSVPRIKQDVAYVTLRRVGAMLKKHDSETALTVEAGSLQVDDVTEDHPVFPVVLQREPPPAAEVGASGETQPPQRPARLLFVELLQSSVSADVVVVRGLHVKLQPLVLQVADRFLSEMLGFADELNRTTLAAAAAAHTPHSPSTLGLYGSEETAGAAAGAYVPASSHLVVKRDAAFADKAAYISSLVIAPVTVTVSFMRQQEEDGQHFAQYHSNRWWLGYIMRSVESTTLECVSFGMQDTSLPIWVLKNRVMACYWSALRYQVLVKIPWSTSFLGNPASTIRGLGQGLTDLVAKPYQRISEANSLDTLVTGSIIGVAQGIGSLVTKTTGGLAGSVSSLTRSFARTTSKWACDPEWVSDRQQNHGSTVAQGVFDGVGGFFQSPVSGYNDHGIAGATSGLARGAVGLITKPVTGVLDGLSDGLDLLSGKGQVGERVRPPRVFPSDPVVLCPSGQVDEAAVLSSVYAWRRGEVQPAELKAAVPSFVSLSRVLSWDEFRSVCTKDEFYAHARHARDAFLSTARPTHAGAAAQEGRQDLTRVTHLVQTLGIAAIASDPSLQVSYAELAGVTSWDVFRTLLTPDLFYEHAHLARDRCVLETRGFKCL